MKKARVGDLIVGYCGTPSNCWDNLEIGIVRDVFHRLGFVMVDCGYGWSRPFNNNQYIILERNFL